MINTALHALKAFIILIVILVNTHVVGKLEQEPNILTESTIEQVVVGPINELVAGIEQTNLDV